MKGIKVASSPSMLLFQGPHRQLNTGIRTNYSSFRFQHYFRTPSSAFFPDTTTTSATRKEGWKSMSCDDRIPLCKGNLMQSSFMQGELPLARSTSIVWKLCSRAKYRHSKGHWRKESI